MSILLIDNNEKDLLLVAKLLEEAGHESIITISSKDDAYTIFPRYINKINLIILGHQLHNNTDELEVLKFINNYKDSIRIPVIIITDDVAGKIIKPTMDFFSIITKPYRKIDMLSQVSTAKKLGEYYRERAIFDKLIVNNEKQQNHDIIIALDQWAIVSITDLKGNMTYVNAKFVEISGYELHELIGSNQNIVNSGYHPKSFFKTMWETIKRGEKWRGEICNQAKDGSLYWVDSVIVPFIDPITNKVYQYVSIRKNITQRKKLEKKLERDLSLAYSIQKAVISEPISNSCISIDSFNFPSNYVSGDLYNFYEINEHKYACILIDVMGHGIAASLLTMAINSFLHELIIRKTKPSKVLEKLQDRFYKITKNMDFVEFFTVVYAVIDVKEKTITYCSCGHPPAFLIIDDELHELSAEFPPIGAINIEKFHMKKISYKTGKENVYLVLYTDGLHEVFRHKDKNLKQVILQNYQNVTRLKNYISDLKNSNKLLDDTSFVSIKLHHNGGD